MELTGAGTAIMVAIAAALWFAYFVPTWMRRREYLDTERTATRLQQTLRVMAETAELPEQVRVEVSARDAARHERVLRAEQRRADAVVAHVTRRPGQASALASQWRPETAPAQSSSAQRLRRRRAHRLATLLMAAATVTIGVQLLFAMTTGMAPAGWIVLGAGAAIGVVGVSVRRRLDARSAPRAAASLRATSAVVQHVASAPVRRASAWTPVPVPKPLYLGRPEAQTVQPAPDVAARLRAAAFAAEQQLRAAHEEPEVVPFRPQRRPAPETIEAPTSRLAMPSRWAAMGRVDGTDAAAPDLDEVLRRRRSAG